MPTEPGAATCHLHLPDPAPNIALLITSNHASQLVVWSSGADRDVRLVVEEPSACGSRSTQRKQAPGPHCRTRRNACKVETTDEGESIRVTE
jgi:hypothetical protein